jgi:lactoylglutathione lyase
MAFLRATVPFLLLSAVKSYRTSFHFSKARRLIRINMSFSSQAAETVPGRPTLHHTMIRIKDPSKSIPFYESLGFSLLDSFDFPQYKFSLYFMASIPEGEVHSILPGTQAAHDRLWMREGVALELTHNHGSETDDSYKLHTGNEEKDGFGHLAINVDDVYATSEKFEKMGYRFKKKPDEGRMKGLSFLYDPDGYWVEIVKRGENAKIKNKMNFSQTMLRIKDPVKSLAFYKALGMKVLTERHFDSFSLYFLGSSNAPDDASPKDLFQPVLELTHNHGTENDESFKYFTGNEEGRQGFGHIAFLVDDVEGACDAIEKMGYGFKKKPNEGSMKGLAFAFDPDGYAVEIIPRAGIDFGDAKTVDAS